MYIEGEYFKNPKRHIEDTEYKVNSISNVLFRFLDKNSISLTSIADVGCGSGEIIKLLASKLIQKYGSVNRIAGFDISPHVKELKDENVEFLFQDFTQSSEEFDLVILNDVFEHVLNPIKFLNNIGLKSKYIIMHIPLEDCLSVKLRNLQMKKIKDPGHLIYLNVISALNMITFSGLKIIEYEYSIESVKAPSNRKSIIQKLSFPFKWVLIKINPYIYSKIFGISLVVIAKGLNE